MTSEPWGGKTLWLFLRLCQKAEKKGVEKVYLALHQLESAALVTPPCDVPGPDTVRVRQDGPLCNGHDVLSKYSRHTAHYFILNMFLKAYIWFSTWSEAWDENSTRYLYLVQLLVLMVLNSLFSISTYSNHLFSITVEYHPMSLGHCYSNASGDEIGWMSRQRYTCCLGLWLFVRLGDYSVVFPSLLVFWETILLWKIVLSDGYFWVILPLALTTALTITIRNIHNGLKKIK